MSYDELMTLKEIAKELRVKYKTLYTYKRAFSGFLKVHNEGRLVKYPPSTLKFFATILEMKQDGLGNSEIAKTITDSIREGDAFGLSGCLDVGLSGCRSGCLSGCLDVGLSDDLSDCRSGCLSDDLSDCLAGKPDHKGAEKTHYERACNDQAAIGKGAYIYDQQSEAGKFSEGNPENELAGGQVEALKEQLENLGEQLRAEFQADLASMKRDTLARVTRVLDGMVEKINTALLETQGSLEVLHAAQKHMAERLSQLEQDLGAAFVSEKIDELPGITVRLLPVGDMLEKELPEARERGGQECQKEDGEQVPPMAEISWIRSSMENGRPSKAAVVQWLKAQKQLNPKVTAADLAETLTTAGIPTLRGKAEWNVGVVRGLATS